MSYWALIAMVAESQENYELGLIRESQMCPNDMTPLQDSPHGLFCPWDGWTPDEYTPTS